MRAAVVRVDVVREGEDRLVVAVVVLQRDSTSMPSFCALQVDRLVVDDRLVLVQVLDELAMPPSYWNLWLLPWSRSSSSVMVTPPFRNASSRSRWASVS